MAKKFEKISVEPKNKALSKLMGDNDFSFSGNVQWGKDQLLDNAPISVSNIDENDFSKNLSSDHPFLVKFHAINRFYSSNHKNMEKLLNDMGIVTRGSNMYCPFHDDEIGGKPSAKYHPDSDMVYCFSESKVFTAYHVLKDLYGMNMDKVFTESWLNLCDTDREELLSRYGDEQNIDTREFINPLWKSLDNVLTKFSKNGVNFKQHRNALYKVMIMIVESNNTNNETTMMLD